MRMLPLRAIYASLLLLPLLACTQNVLWSPNQESRGYSSPSHFFNLTADDTDHPLIRALPGFIIIQPLSVAEYDARVNDGKIRFAAAGFIWSKDNKGGYIITASHILLKFGKEIVVRRGRKAEKPIPARQVVISFLNTDLGMLHVEKLPRGSNPVRRGNPDQVDVGDKLYGICPMKRPMFFQTTLSAKNVTRKITLDGFTPNDTLSDLWGFFIGQDPNFCSGSWLITENAEVVGLFIAGSKDGFSVAIPISKLEEIADKIIEIDVGKRRRK